MQIICIYYDILFSMLTSALGAAVLVALVSLIGVFFFGEHTGRLSGMQKYAIPTAVGVFLSLILFELIPETLELSPEYGAIAVAFGFISFYVLANVLHQRYHHLEAEDCDRKGAALLLLVGDTIHNLADGVILGGAFLIDPAVGIATAIGLALHEIPQEIVEFGVLVRGGFSRARAALFNLLSASSIIVGVLIIMLVSEHFASYVWVLTGVAAGNLLFLAASDLLPRIHGNLKHYGSIWNAALSITVGFLLMTIILMWTHETFGHGEEMHAEDNEIVDEH